MRESPSQVFCANTLFRSGVIDGIYLEDGAVGEPDATTLMRRLWRYGPRGVWRRIRRDLRDFDGHVPTLLDYYVTRLRTAGLMDRQAQQETQLLGEACRRLDPGLRVSRGGSVNDPPCRELIHDGGYRLVCVFGTGLLTEELLAMEGVSFVNLHHGWLPRFRGEGILSALAEEGTEGLGVTVHLVDRGVDTGPILYRERLTVESVDNAYALALKATLRGTSLFHQVYHDAQHGVLRGIPQDSAAGCLYSAKRLKRSPRMRLAAANALRTLTAARARPSRVKQVAVRMAVAGGLTLLSRRRHGCRLRILMYHGVLPRVTGPAAFGNLFVEADLFARHLRYLARAFTVVSLDDVLACVTAGRPFPERAVMVTFDDGYRQTLETIMPLLRTYHVPVTACVPADDVQRGSWSWFDLLRVLVHECARERTALRIAEELVIDGRTVRSPEETFMSVSRRLAARPSSWWHAVMPALLAAGGRRGILERYPEFAPAGWTQWREAVTTKLVTVGSHGLTHRNLTDLAQPEQVTEALESKRLIERELGRPCRVFAYPYGAWNPVVVETVRSAGYTCAMTTDEGLNAATHRPYELYRTMIGDKGNFALFCARVSGLREAVA